MCFGEVGFLARTVQSRAHGGCVKRPTRIVLVPILMPSNPPVPVRRPLRGSFESKKGKVQVMAACDALFAAGAIATLEGEPRAILVGDLQWLPGRGILLFTAHGDARADAHLIQLDEAVTNGSGSLTFLRAGHVVGSIHRIEEADVENTDDYRIAWQLWQEVAPLYRQLIERHYETIRCERAH